MNSRLRHFIQTKLPFIARYGRYLIALRDRMLPMRTSYSQNGEDRAVFDALTDYDLSKGIYVDVGANQPTKISNTYLFYRHGCRGVAIEPNRDLSALFRCFRPRDITVSVGCGEEASVMEFRHSVASVFSTFSDVVIEGQRKSEFVPVMPLDKILAPIPHRWIFYLSIDAEGFDFAVLKGAIETLKETLLVTIEHKSARSEILEFLRVHGFDLISESQDNLLFRSHRDFSQYKKVS